MMTSTSREETKQGMFYGNQWEGKGYMIKSLRRNNPEAKWEEWSGWSHSKQACLKHFRSKFSDKRFWQEFSFALFEYDPDRESKPSAGQFKTIMIREIRK